MARMNTLAVGPDTRTHEGTPAARLTPIKELRRSVLSALLWEDSFYETGSEIAARIAPLVAKAKPTEVAALAVEARDRMYLRHVPLFLVRQLAKTKGNGSLVAETLAHVIQRPDEMGEYLALYWDGKTTQDKRPEPLSAGSKRGLALAFRKFNESTLAKYDRDTGVKLRDVLRLVHPRANDTAQAAAWRRVIARELVTPDTWEVALSAGANKRDVFERLLREQKLGGLAFLRNLRNMIEAGVDESLIRARFDGPFDKVLPFRFIAAAKHAIRLESDIERAMLRCLNGLPTLTGRTALIIDTSPSMWMAKVSARSEMDRFDAAAALAILARGLCESVRVWAFNARAYEVPSRQGFALRDALAATKGSASCGGLAVTAANAEGYDRIIVLTDGQWHYMDGMGYRERSAQDVSPPPLTPKAYMVNVSTQKTGIGYGPWVSIDGWSERIFDFIRESEQSDIP